MLVEAGPKKPMYKLSWKVKATIKKNVKKHQKRRRTSMCDLHQPTMHTGIIHSKGVEQVAPCLCSRVAWLIPYR